MPFPTTTQQKEICDLYRSGLRLEDVAKKSGFCTTTIKKTMVLNACPSRKRGKHKLGHGPVVDLDDELLVKFKGQWDKLDSTVKGTIAEMHVKTRLSELGFDVWEPFCQNHKTDLFILHERSILRIQVKSATYDLKTKAFRANVTRHRRGGRKTSYTLEDVDFFIIYCGGLDTLKFYVTPANLVIGRTDMKLYPHRQKGAFLGGPEWEKFLDSFDLLRAK
jgi:hypothetical protein